ncbi:hypothetical protein, partial [Escherichia coli]|uniref:hypothetical protein n=1 Tax=Escherichia coli TaxID=562 RepID=UPI0022F021ED
VSWQHHPGLHRQAKESGIAFSGHLYSFIISTILADQHWRIIPFTLFKESKETLYRPDDFFKQFW